MFCTNVLIGQNTSIIQHKTRVSIDSDTIQGGTIPINGIVDLSEYAVIEGDTTVYQIIGGDGFLNADLSPSLGIFKLPEQIMSFYLRQTMTWSMTNKHFSNGIKYYQFTIGESDIDLYHPSDLEGLKKFLLQDGFDNKKNYEYLGLTEAEMQSYDAEAIAKLNISWSATIPARVQSIDILSQWHSKNISGIFDASYFPLLEHLYLANTHLKGLKVEHNDRLKSLNITHTDVTFSTIPLPSDLNLDYEYSFRALLDTTNLYNIGHIFDFSSQYMIEGVKTDFTWIKYQYLGADPLPVQMIELGNGKFQIPIECLGYHLELIMTNRNFPDSFNKDTLSTIVKTYWHIKADTNLFEKADTDILRNFLMQKIGNTYNYEYFTDDFANRGLDLEKMERWDGDVISSIRGITWTNTVPIQIKKIEWNDLDLGGVFDAIGLKELESLNLANNQLTGIKIDNPKLTELIINNNRLTLLDLPLKNNLKTYMYAPQATIEAGDIPLNHLIDMSKYSVINGINTNFHTTNNAQLNPFSVNPGVFKLPEQVGYSYLGDQTWSMTNATFPDLLQLYHFTVIDADMNNYDSSDLEGLKKFLLQDGLNNKKNYEYFDLDQEDMDRWDAHTIAELAIGWSGTTPARVQKIDYFSDWHKRNITGIFDASYFPMLEELYLVGTYVNGLKVEKNDSLKKVDLSGTNVLFSTIPQSVGLAKSYKYEQLRTLVDDKEYKVGDVVDYSSEYSINGVKTKFEWSDDGGETYNVKMIDLGEGKFEIPLQMAGKKLLCRMTNRSFEGVEIKTSIQNIAELTLREYKTEDVEKLKAFLLQKSFDRYNYSYLRLTANDMNNWDANVIQQLSDITWTNTYPMEIKIIDWHDKGFEGELDLLGLNSLEKLYCSYNNLSAVRVNSGKLTTLEINNNSIRFSDLPFLNIKDYRYTNQTIIEPDPKSVNQIIDLSSEYSINDSISTYIWKSDNTTVYPINIGNGKFVAGNILAGKTLQCEVRNSLFPQLVLHYEVYIDDTTTGIEDNNKINSVYIVRNTLYVNENLEVINTTLLTGKGYLYTLRGQQLVSFKIEDRYTTIPINSKGVYILNILMSDKTFKKYKIIVR